PNEKHVNPSGSIPSGSWLTYTVNFQNTGNDTAYNVFILDTLDSNFDMNTFLPLAASHPYQTYMQSGNIVKFAFDNIMLPDSNINEPLSRGWITYRIKSLNGLPFGTLLNNTAYIYFDFNSAVVTNTTSTMIDDIVSTDEINSALSSVQIHPNPAGTQLAISSKQFAINTIEIYDVLGQKVFNFELRTLNSGQQTTFDISKLNPGIYFVSVGTDEGKIISKLIKQ
ncbi:MAG TPA: T9SS type A sorting domain-containing protein, partial [Bacteroidia bacterium]|nr:T9SS type A sorting domain-containing protein [Bacteroidia bacterium]